MSIRWKLITGALSFLLLFVAVFVATTYVTSGQKDDGLVINLAGRQRMLSEKMTKEVLAYAEDPSEENWEAFGRSKKLFATTQAALTEGGDAPTTMDAAGETAAVPAATDDVIRARLGETQATFDAFVEASDRLDAEARAAKDEGDMVIAQAPELLAKLDSVLKRAQKVASNEMLDAEARAEWTQIIRLVSRQSLVAQKLGTLALSYLRAPTENDKQALEAALEVFDGTHSSLSSGGTVLLDLTDEDSGVMIASAPNVRVQQALEETGEAWAVFRRALRGVELAAVARADAVKEALSHSPTILAAMTVVVDRAQSLSESKVTTIQMVQIGALGLGILLVIFASLMGNRIGANVIHAVDAAETIADGDLTHRSEATSKDETGRLLGSLNDMTSQLSELVQQVQLSGVSVGSSSTQIAASAKRQESAVSDPLLDSHADRGDLHGDLRHGGRAPRDDERGR